MSDFSGEESGIVPVTNWKPKALAIGALAGAVVGALAAYLVIQNTEEDAPPKITAGQGVRLGVLVFGLLKSIASLRE